MGQPVEEANTDHYRVWRIHYLLTIKQVGNTLSKQVPFSGRIFRGNGKEEIRKGLNTEPIEVRRKWKLKLFLRLFRIIYKKNVFVLVYIFLSVHRFRWCCLLCGDSMYHDELKSVGRVEKYYTQTLESLTPDSNWRELEVFNKRE